MDRLAAHRAFYASLITGGLGEERKPIEEAFRKTHRENFMGPGPWRVLTGGGYIETPTNDPALIYQDVLVALAEGGINNGQPSLHALCLGLLKVREGEGVVQVGAGTGYYTAILAQLVGEGGWVTAFEIDRGLAARARGNLAGFQNVRLEERSGTLGPLPECDVVYVNAGAMAPLAVWVDALRLGGRLLFPLAPTTGVGAMLLVTRRQDDRFEARFETPALFIPCRGVGDEEAARHLDAAFKRGDASQVRWLERGSEPDRTCWVAGKGWWLSTASGGS